MKVADGEGRISEVELVPAEREITIRDLLTHTSGLLSRRGSARGRSPKELLPEPTRGDLASLVPRLATVPLDFQPGSRWRYSGLAGIDTLSRVVEVASGMPFDEFLGKRIFEPLGMNDTSFVVPDDRQDRLATVYRSTDKAAGEEPRPPSGSRRPISRARGAGLVRGRLLPVRPDARERRRARRQAAAQPAGAWS